MPRLNGKEGLLAGVMTRATRVRGRDLPQPGLLAHAPRLLLGVGALHTQVQARGALDAKLKQLALLKVSTQVGCPN